MTPIEELLERDAIKNVRIMYSHYFDMGDLDNLASLFSEDGRQHGYIVNLGEKDEYRQLEPKWPQVINMCVFETRRCAQVYMVTHLHKP